MTDTNKKAARIQQTGRFRAAWLVLTGQRLTPQQMQADWLVIQTQAADIFNKFSSLAARLVKAEKRALELAMETIDEGEVETQIGQNPMALPGGDRKAALRRRAYQRRTGGKMRRRPDEHADQSIES